MIPVLHGKNGEDGTIQGLLQLAGIPFVGCDMTSSTACMDKVITNVMLEQAGIPRQGSRGSMPMSFKALLMKPFLKLKKTWAATLYS